MLYAIHFTETSLSLGVLSMVAVVSIIKISTSANFAVGASWADAPCIGLWEKRPLFNKKVFGQKMNSKHNDIIEFQIYEYC